MAKILILEPDEDTATNLSNAIQRAGLPTIVIREGQSAVTQFQKESPDLIMLDLGIDDGHGLELCQAIRKIPGGELVPILLVGTGQEGVKNFGDALAEGGDYYFSKPLDLRKVVSKIRTYVGVDRETPTQVAPHPALPKKDEGPSKDLAGRVEQMMGLGEVFKEGLLSPPEESQEGGEERLEQLEKQLFGDEEGTKAQTAAATLEQPVGEEEDDEVTEESEASSKLSAITTELAELQEGEDLGDEDELEKEAKAWDSIEGELKQPTEETTQVVDAAEMEKKAKRDAEEKARKEAEEKARKEAAEKDLKEAARKVVKEAEEKAKREAEEKAKRKAEEKAKREAEEKAKREAEEKAKREAEEKAKREAEEKAKREAEEKAKREAEEKAKREAEEKAKREAEEKAKREAEEKARREADRIALREADEKARLEAETKAKRDLKEKAKREAEEKAKREAEEKAKREAEERAKREAEEKAKRETEEKAKREAEEKAKREAEEKAKREAEEKAKREAEEKARREAEEQARLEAQEKARQEAEEQAQPEAEEPAPAVDQPEDEEQAEQVDTDVGMEMPYGKDEGFLEDDEAGRGHSFQAEDLWGDKVEEQAGGVENMADTASAWMEDSLDQYQAEPESEEPTATMAGGSRLVELLEREATLAREHAADEPDSPIVHEVPTDSNLPPRPGEEVDDRRAILHREPADQDAFPEEQTEDIKSRSQIPAAGEIEDEFDEPTTSQLRGVQRQMRALDFRRAKPAGPAVQPGFVAPDPDRTDLSQESVPEVLWRLYIQEVTGMVTFRSQGGSKEVFLEAGVPVDVRSTQTADRLEEVLFRDGLIDRAAYAEARIKGLEQPRALAAHLVERGLIRPEELFPLVRRHLEDCLLGLFEWIEGSVSYTMTYAPDAEKVKLARSMPSLILEGIRRKFLLERMVRQLGSPASLLVPVASEDRSQKLTDPEQFGFVPAEEEILNLVNGMRPIEEIVFLSGQGANMAYRVLLAGVITGWLAVAVKGVRAGVQDMDESARRNLEISRRRVEAKFDQINRASYFEILGVSEEATAYEIDNAFSRLSREFHPVQFAHPDLQDLNDKLDAIRRTLDEARDVLADELLREGYRQSLS